MAGRKDIETQAAAWFARRDAGRLSADQQAALDQWLAADPAHQAAFDRLSALWSRLGAVPAADSDRLRSQARTAAQRRRRRAGALAAATTGALILALLTDLPMRLRADIRTAAGEQRVATLEDGSEVRLNTASAISVDYGAGRRTVRLLAGEAAFVVRSDPARRPFTVEAGNGTATARGTAFIVRRDGERVRVTVTEHVVAVAENGAAEVEVAQGHAVSYGPDGRGAVVPADTYAAGAWTAGRLVFDNLPLDQVIAELGRYSPGLVQALGDLSSIRVSGVFPAADPAGSIALLAGQFGLNTLHVGDRLTLVYR